MISLIAWTLAALAVLVTLAVAVRGAARVDVFPPPGEAKERSAP